VDSAVSFPVHALGLRVPRAGRGVIHSVFARTLNLSGSGTWFALQSPEVPAIAHGVQVLWPFQDLRDHFAEGAAWRWQGEHLAIVLRDGRQLRVSTQGATTWCSPLRAHAIDERRVASRAREVWRECSRLADGRSVFWGGALDHPPRLVGRARRGLRALRRARVADEIDGAVRALIGLGPGLTPAGDDALIGWLAGTALLPSHRARGWLAQEARCAIAQYLPRTTDVSRAHLEDALAGQFSHALSQFANALAADSFDADHAGSALFELARVGASSGLDAAAGLLAGVTTATRPASSAMDGRAQSVPGSPRPGNATPPQRHGGMEISLSRDAPPTTLADHRQMGIHALSDKLSFSLCLGASVVRQLPEMG
jgi:hypothetical protein